MADLKVYVGNQAANLYAGSVAVIVADGQFNNITTTTTTSTTTTTTTVNPIPISQTNLLRYYTAQNASSYPGTGTTWTDLKGSGYNMTLTNGPTYATGTPNYIAFDGSNDYGTSNSDGLSYGSAARSMGIWINPQASVDGGTVFDYGTLDYNKWIWYAMQSGRTPNPAISVNFYGPWIPSSLAGNPSGMNAPLYTWTYICWTWASNGDWAFNVNGVNTRTGNQAGDVNTVQSNPFNIGGPGSPLAMRVGEFFYYNTAISEATNLANYNATKANYGY